MALDAHVHLGRRHLPAEEALGLMEQAGISGAVVFADPESEDLAGDNRYVLEVCRRRPSLVPFLYVGGNPYGGFRHRPPLPPPESLAPYRGIKWHCLFTPGHDAGGMGLPGGAREMEELLSSAPVAALLGEAERRRLPVCLEEQFDVTLRMVELYPGVRFVIPHLGMLNGGSARVLAALGDRGSVRFDTSLAGTDAATVRRLGVSRFLLGSDHPYGGMLSAVARVKGMGLASGEEAAVLGGNLAALLGEAG